MIGFVDVKVETIKKAYNYLNKDEELAQDALSTDKTFKERISNMGDIMNNSRGKASYFKKSEKVKLKKLLEEVAYASFATDKDSMFIRIEMASIILDIIRIYEPNVDK